MAYASKELKLKVLENIKSKAKAMGVKLKVSAKIYNHSTLIINIAGCSVDIPKNNLETLQKNISSEDYVAIPFHVKEKLKYAYNKNKDFDPVKNIESYGNGIYIGHYNEHSFSGKALEVIEMVKKEIDIDNYNNSDSMTDYFDVGYYTEIKIADNKGGFKLL